MKRHSPQHVAQAVTISLLACFTAAFTPRSVTAVTLNPLFGDHAVVQRGEPVAVWGTAEPHADVAVTAAGVVARTVADAAGRWRVQLGPIVAEGPFTLVAQSGERTATSRDVVTGEVWLASGQSNMARALRQAATGQDAIARADDPSMRFFKVAARRSLTSRSRVEGSWAVVSPETAPHVSAVAYFFAERLRAEMGRPVGIIQAAVGGTTGETWLPLERVRATPALGGYAKAWEVIEREHPQLASEPDEALESWEHAERSFRESMRAFRRGDRNERPQRTAPNPYRDAIGAHYRAMIEPVAPYRIRGMIWYQGEANARSPEMGRDYAPLLTALIESWRAEWRRPDLPFLFVQLPEFSAREGWWWVRDSQRRVAATVPHTAMVVSLGSGDMNDIHPARKAPVGEGLARSALRLAYQRPGPVSGPIAVRAEFRRDAAEVRFIHVDGGLRVEPASHSGFEIADDTGAFHPAQVRVVAPDRLMVRAPGAGRATAVRYGFANDPPLTLFDESGLPASPFIESNPTTRTHP